MMIDIDTPMPPPDWALLERELIRANTAACTEFVDKYFDDRGYLRCVARWGGNDGPDDAMENCTDWPILHALGADDVVLEMYKKAWEGHLRQYTEARTSEVPFARDGMYYKEFPVMFDWLHNAEGLVTFNLQGLSDPCDQDYQRRVRRYAGFYMNEDPGAPNYDPTHKIIRSMFNGSRGPLLRKATPLDWAGDPIEVENRFRPLHGERNYEEMLGHFKDYTDVIGDHPSNLSSTTLALNAYMLTGEEKYKNWLLEYVDAWGERIVENGGIIPTNIGLDGKIGGAVGGKWYGGCYGWAFSVIVPQSGEIAHRTTHYLGLIGFGNAYLLTGDDRYLDGWRKMIDKINAQGKMIDGQMMYPQMYGDNGWYAFSPHKYSYGAHELWYWSMRSEDLERLTMDGWVGYLNGKIADYPTQALHADFSQMRNRVTGMRNDKSTPDTRMSDDPNHLNPCSVRSLIHLMLGGLPPGNRGTALHCRVRYFDPKRRRAGISEDVAALVEGLTSDAITLSLININPVDDRTVIIQAGGYGEHQFTALRYLDRIKPVDTKHLTVRLQPGCGTRLTLGMRLYCNQPTMSMPWGSI